MLKARNIICGEVLLLLSLLAGCGQPPQPTAVQATVTPDASATASVTYQPTVTNPPPTSLPTSTNLPPTQSPTITDFPATSTPSPVPATPLPDQLYPPYPDLVLGIQSPDDTLYSCHDLATSRGEVAISHYPYTQTQTILSDRHAWFYEPLASPTGEWIAAVAIRFHTLPEADTNVGGGILYTFADSDSVWLVRPDGSDAHQITRSFTRSEIHFTKGGCEAWGGVFDIEGWSTDGQWLVYHSIQLPTDDADTGIYLLNIVTGEERSYDWTPVWAPVSNRLALQNEQGVQVIDLRDNAPPESYAYPPELVNALSSILSWRRDETALLLFVDQRQVDAPFSRDVWQLDLASGRWQRLGEIARLNTVQVLGDRIVVCYWKRLSFLDVDTLQEMSHIEVQQGFYCTDMRSFTDSHGYPVLSLQERDDIPAIVATSPYFNVPTLEQIVDFSKFNIPARLQVHVYSWIKPYGVP